ncbi:MAG: hypothetical protein GOU99_00370 [Candidatus Altiarchaeota archaeon]|nr:hypothetical protein [Candidatus Altiarchaeota archaeon]
MEEKVITAYDKLRKKYPKLPVFSELRKMPISLKEEDVKDVESVLGLMFRYLHDLGVQLEVFITPPNFYSMQDKAFLKDKKQEVSDLFVKVHYLMRSYMVELHKAADSKNPEAELVKLINSVFNTYIKEIRPVYRSFIIILAEKWKTAEMGSTNDVYHG